MIFSLISWIYLLTGQFFYLRGKTERALFPLKKSCEGKAPRGAFLYYGLALASQGEYDRALEALAKSQLDPEVIALFRGKILVDSQRWDEAKQAFSVVLEKNPHHWLAKSYALLCQCHHSAKEAGADQFAGLEKFKKTGALAPEKGFQARLYAFCIQKLCQKSSENMEKEWESQRKFYAENLQESSGGGDKYLSRCDNYLTDRKYSLALESARVAVEEDPCLPSAHLRMAYSLWKNHRLEEAQKHLLKRQKLWFYQSLLDPESLIALSLQVGLYIRRNRLASACKTMALLEALSLEEWESRMAKAEVLCSLRKIDEGCKILEGLYDEDPEEFTQQLLELIDLVNANKNPSQTKK